MVEFINFAEFRKRLGQKFREARIDRGLTNKEVARKTYISKGLLFAYEHGRALPSLENLKTLCEFYELSADELLEIKYNNNYRQLGLTLEDLLALKDIIEKEGAPQNLRERVSEWIAMEKAKWTSA
ncbi:MAG: hypothetical protein KatS3mg087_1317 [Patescibacteria group bacterium]|nr:MAG: hypothetical protein KatS3mg087_1317 [Patescibacteria group bacterium]